MADTTLSIAVTAELADFRKAMADLPGIGEKEARDMVTGIRRQLQAAERAARGAGGAVRKELGGAFGDVENIATRSLEKMGGQFGDLGDIVFDIVGPLGKIHPALMAIGGTATAVGATAGAMFKLANAAVEARDRLEEAGEFVDAEASNRLDVYSRSTGNLGTAFDRLKVAIGSDIALGLAAVTDAAASGVNAFKDLRDSGDMTLEVFGLINRATLALVTFGFSELLRATYDQVLANYELQVSTGELTLMEKMAVQAQQMAAIAKQDEAEGARQNALAKAEEAEALRKQTEAAREATEAERELNDAIADALAADEFSDPRPVLKAIEDKAQRTIDALGETADAIAKTKDEAAKAHKAIASMSDVFAAENKERTQQALQEAGSLVMDTASTVTDTLMELNQRTIDDFNSRIEAGEKLSLAEVRLMEQAQQRQKAAAIAQAAYQAAVTGAGVAANLAPALGPVGVGIGVAIGAGLFAAEMAAINSESALSFNPWDYYVVPGGEADQRNLLANADDDGQITSDDFEGGGKAPSAPDGATGRRGGGGTMRVEVGINPRTKGVTVATNDRPGKRPRRGG